MAGKPNYVLDSFALLAYLQGEAGMARVQQAFEEAGRDRAQVYMCIINLGETLYIVERELGLAKAHEILAAIQELPIEILPAENQLVMEAAHIKANYAVSYADAFAVACAQNTHGTVLTGDKEFETVESLIGVEWLTGN